MIKILLCLIFSKAFRLPRQGHVAVLGGGVGVASMRAITEQAASLSQPLPHHNKDSTVHHERQYTEVIHPDCLTQQLANPTSRTRGATNDYYQVEQERIEVNLSPKRPRLSPKHQWKGHLPGKQIFVSKTKKGQSLNPAKSQATQRNPGPNPASSDCPRRRSPSASIDSQEEVPQSQQSQEVTQSQSASIASHEVIQGTQER